MSSSSKDRWEVSVTVDGEDFRWRREGADFVAEWPGTLRVYADASGRVRSAEPWPGANEAAVRKLLSGVATAFARSVAGKISLHASAVAIDGQALVCVGASGAGKSTIAAALCRLPGVALLGDDVTAVEPIGGRWFVLPTESVHWLATVGGEKQAQVAPVIAEAAVPLRSIAAIDFEPTAAGIVLRVTRAAEAFGLLLSSPLRFSLKPECRLRELDALTALGVAVPVVRVTRSKATTPEVFANALLTLIGQDRGTGGADHA